MRLGGPLVIVLALVAAGCVSSGADVAPQSEEAATPPAPLPVVAAPTEETTTSAGPTGDPAPVEPEVVLDPLLDGPLAVELAEYEFELTLGENEGGPLPYPVRLRGNVHYPKDGEGPYPFLLFMHGRHGTCFVAVTEILGVPACPDAPPVVAPVDSYTGYDYLARNLATHGYVVASVDANAVNDNDANAQDAGAQGRAQIVVRTLDHFARLHEEGGEGLGDALRGRLDLTRIGLMGHSRGGEGVTYAIGYNAERPDGGEPHAIKAVFALAPIDRKAVTAPGVAFATLLPYCDGDVWTLSGARIFDDSRRLGDEFPKTQLLVMGANHNYYNTVWTADDAAWASDDPHCGKEADEPGHGRLSPEDQRLEGHAHMAAFFRLHIGGESGYAPLFDGTATLPPSACPGGEGACPDLVHVAYAPPASRRLLLEDFAAMPTTADVGGAVVASGLDASSACEPADCSEDVHVAGSAKRVVLGWSAPARVSVALPEAARDASRYSHVVLRAAFEPGAAAPDAVAIEVVDAMGARAVVRAADVSRSLYEPPGGDEMQHVVLSDVRVPLSAFAGVDASRLVEVAIVLGAVEGGARMHVADLELQDLAP